jgi:hypothetical protein
LAGVVWLAWHGARVSGSGPQGPSYDDLVVLVAEQAVRIAEQGVVIARDH